jgi:hypothetical protein
VEVETGRTTQTRVSLSVEAIALEPILVIGVRRRVELPGLEDFERRYFSGWGQFVLEEEIRTRNPSKVTDVLSQTGVEVTANGAKLTMRRTNCAPMVYIDGVKPVASPSMSIGQNGGAEYELFQVTGAVRLSDGRIVVLNASSGQVAVFSAAGRHLVSHGGVGEGPGEFAQAARLFLGRADSLLVWDSRTLRITVLTAEGGLARTIRLHPHPEAPRLEGVDAQGKILVVASHFEGPSLAGISRLPESYLLYAGDGSRVDSLGQAPGMAGVVRASSERVEVLRPLVSPTTSYAFAGGKLWIATGEAHRVGVLDLETRTERVITWAGPDLLSLTCFPRPCGSWPSRPAEAGWSWRRCLGPRVRPSGWYSRRPEHCSPAC